MNPFLLPVHHTPTKNVTVRRLLLVAVSLISVVAVTLPRPASASTAGWTDSELVPTSSTDSQVNAVSCVSDSFCVAGGRTETYGETKAFLSTFDGKSWTDHPADAAADTGSNSTVLTVSCLSRNFCVAGGYDKDATGNHHAFISMYNGTVWTDREVAGQLNGGGWAAVFSVSCTSRTACVAGGYYFDHSGNNQSQAFVSVYNGSTWVDHEVAGSLNAGNSAWLNSVSCTTATSCAGGGFYTDGNGNRQAFVTVYNGSTWVDHEVVGSLDVGAGQDGATVTSVSCGSPTLCVAGGSYTAGSDINHYLVHAFVSVYNGKTWVGLDVASSLNQGQSASVNSVTCTSATSCVAGGVYTDINNVSQAFVSVFDGKVWTDTELAGSLNVGGRAQVNSVSCASASACVASGFDRDGDGGYQAFASMYDGKMWADNAVAGSLNVGQRATSYSVTCVITGFCVTGGYYQTAMYQHQAFASFSRLSAAPTSAMPTIYFAFGSSGLDDAAKRSVKTVAKYVVARHQSVVTLAGFTDPVGPASYNRRLAAARAVAVRDYLTTQLRSLGENGVGYVIHAMGITNSGPTYASDRKVTIR